VKGEGRLEKDPDRRVQEAISSVFNKFLELGTARQTLLWFLEHGLQLPARDMREELRWKRPSYATIYRMLTNPAYVFSEVMLGRERKDATALGVCLPAQHTSFSI
jgi:hypothetical protein